MSRVPLIPTPRRPDSSARNTPALTVGGATRSSVGCMDGACYASAMLQRLGDLCGGRRLAWAAMLLVVAVFVAACGDSEPSQSEQGEPAAATAEVEQQQSDESGAEAADDEAEQQDSGEAETAAVADEVEQQQSSAETEASAASEQAEPQAAAETARSGESIEWSECGPSLECGALDVPVDYRDPGAGTLQLAVNVHRAQALEQRIGYLLVNPGGPGGSGIEMVTSAADFFAAEVLDRFDIIGFDPRGVGFSEPAFACGEPGEQLALLAAIELPVDTPEEVAAGEAAANLCIDSMGAVGGLLHSEYVARDMDEIRKALGAEQISYLGFSYGSALGVWYATLFPQAVRAMAVDGADNPVDAAGSQEERLGELLEEMAPFESRLEQALALCADTPDCPIYNEGDPVGYYRQAVTKLELVNEAANGDPSAGALGVLGPLYDEADWPALWQGLFDLYENDDPGVLLEFALWSGGITGGTSFTEHVNCLDEWVLMPDLDRETQLNDALAQNQAIAAQLPLAGLLAVDLSNVSTCPFYDQFAPDPLAVPLDGAGVPILVIGNHADPATPFGESEELATETLANGYLVETTHPQHIVYPRNECVNEQIHRALIDGVLPDERRIVCEPTGAN